MERVKKKIKRYEGEKFRIDEREKIELES